MNNVAKNDLHLCLNSKSLLVNLELKVTQTKKKKVNSLPAIHLDKASPLTPVYILFVALNAI